MSTTADARVRRLRAVRSQAREMQAGVRREYQARRQALIDNAVQGLKADWEANRRRKLLDLQAQHEQALVMVGDGMRCAAQALFDDAKEAEVQATTWDTAAATALRRGASALAKDAKVRAVGRARSPAVLRQASTATYNAWGAVPPEVLLRRERLEAAKRKGSRVYHVAPSTPVPIQVATSDDPTSPSFSAVKAAVEQTARRRQRAHDSGRVLLKERAAARRRGIQAGVKARQSTDAKAIVSELKRLQAADRRLRGMRTPAWEPPPDSREGAARRARAEADIERAFERMVA